MDPPINARDAASFTLSMTSSGWKFLQLHFVCDNVLFKGLVVQSIFRLVHTQEMSLISSIGETNLLLKTGRKLLE